MAYLKMLRAILALASLISVSANCGHGTSFYPRDEGHVNVSTFGYSGILGPLAWAGLSPANCACAQGKLQSPIVLNANLSKATSAPNMTIPSVDAAEFENLGSTLEVPLSEGNITFNGVPFYVKQFHFHTPSEHRINDEYYPMEMHMVSQSKDGLITVIAVLFQLDPNGNTTQLISSVVLNLADVVDPGSVTTTGPLDFGPIADAVASLPLYQYAGSLTTPPCTEGVTFLVLAKPLALDVGTYNNIKAVLKFNARYSQNTPGRANLIQVAAEAKQKVFGGSIGCETANNEKQAGGFLTRRKHEFPRF
ncbi:alpha carbonic anhydrase [Mycena leptocephala]|nr:alpha carbonic anhydrase [Mycena leptocephala]